MHTLANSAFQLVHGVAMLYARGGHKTYKKIIHIKTYPLWCENGGCFVQFPVDLERFVRRLGRQVVARKNDPLRKTFQADLN